MIIFLYGKDSYRRIEKKHSIINEFEKKHSNLGIGFFDFSDNDDYSKFRNFIKNQSIFELYKLGVIENCFNIKTKELINDLKKISEHKIFTVIISSDDAPAKEFKFLLANDKTNGNHIIVQKFDYLDGAQWKNFVLKTANNAGINLTKQSLDLLSNAFKKDSWGIATEIQKLSSIREKIIKRSDLEDLDIEISPKFWDLIIGIKSGRLARKISSLERLFSLRESPGKIFNITAYQMPSKTPNFARYDKAVKAGKIDYEDALLDLVIS